MTTNPPTSTLTRRALLTALGVGGLATVGSVYSKVIGTNRASAQARETLVDETRRAWSDAADGTRTVPDAYLGSTLGFLYIPRLRDDVWGFPIVEGTAPRQLNLGIGHMPQTPRPGEDGNVALFGHRTSYGKPFSRFEELRKGDLIIIETKTDWLTYTLLADAQVDPTATWIIKRDPFLTGKVPATSPLLKYKARRMLSLVTCTPKYSTAMRWVWWAALATRSSHAFPPAVISAA